MYVFDVEDPQIMSELEQEKILVFTPSRKIRGKRIVCHDDRYIVRLAAETDGVIVSNDNYRDLVAESQEFRKAIEERLLMYSFVNDRLLFCASVFMPPLTICGRGIMFSDCPSVNTQFTCRDIYLLSGAISRIHHVGLCGNCCKGFHGGQRSKVSGQGHDQTECYNGGGMHFDGVTSRLTCFIMF